MRCPNCGAKIQKTSNICLKCGTKMSQIQNASNAQVAQAKKDLEPEKIVYSEVFPSDLSYKKTLLLCIFLGLFGAHDFYVRKYLKGGILCGCWTAFLIYFSLLGLSMMPDSNINIYIPSSEVFNLITGFLGIMGAVCVIIWALDILNLAFKRFKVPVVLSDK